MKFDLFLKEINQEMIDMGRFAPSVGDSWGGNVWSKECCIINFSKKPGEEVKRPSREGLIMRMEPDGGLAWAPSSNAVYKLDEKAYRVLLDLDYGYSERHAAKRNNVPLREVRDLVAKATEAVGK